MTTTDAVYRGILADLRSGLSSPDDAYVYLTPAPLFTQDDTLFVQVSPGVPEALHPDAGIGFVRETFRVSVWRQLFRDRAGRSDLRVSDATAGVLKTIGDCRQVLIQGWANGVLKEPIVWLRGSTMQESPDNPGWVVTTDEYRMGYEITWSGQEFPGA